MLLRSLLLLLALVAAAPRCVANDGCRRGGKDEVAAGAQPRALHRAAAQFVVANGSDVALKTSDLAVSRGFRGLWGQAAQPRTKRGILLVSSTANVFGSSTSQAACSLAPTPAAVATGRTRTPPARAPQAVATAVDPTNQRRGFCVRCTAPLAAVKAPVDLCRLK